MKRQQILSEIATKGEVLSACKKVSNYSHFADELYSEVLLILCEMDENKLEILHANKQLQYFIVRIILNLWRSTTSPFYKKYRVEHTELQHYHTIEQEEYNIDNDQHEEERLKVAETFLNELYWYDARIFELYHTKYKSYRQMAKEIGIPYRSICKTVLTVKEKINADNRIYFINN